MIWGKLSHYYKKMKSRRLENIVKVEHETGVLIRKSN